jgi:ethanolamine utilization protein EutN
MFLARVVGEVVATIKHRHLAATKLLRVAPEPAPGRAAAPEVIAVDCVDAGAGDRVLVADEGNAAAQVLGLPRGPVRAVVVGVVDAVEPDTAAARGPRA